MGYDVPTPQPRSEHEWATLAISKALLGVDDNAINKLIEEWRGGSKLSKHAFESQLAASTVHALDGLLDSDSIKDIRDVIVRKTKRCA